MSQEYDDYQDDDFYDDDPNNPENKYKHYFKFDPEAWDAWGKMLYNTLNDLFDPSSNVWYATYNVPGFPSKKFPVNSYFSNTGKDKTFQYLGNNYDGVGVWKKKYFISNPINDHHIKHLQSHATYFLKQPTYYKGLFDILN